MTSLLKVKLNRRRDKVHIETAQRRGVKGEGAFKRANWRLQFGVSTQGGHKRV